MENNEKGRNRIEERTVLKSFKIRTSHSHSAKCHLFCTYFEIVKIPVEDSVSVGMRCALFNTPLLYGNFTGKFENELVRMCRKKGKGVLQPYRCIECITAEKVCNSASALRNL